MHQRKFSNRCRACNRCGVVLVGSGDAEERRRWSTNLQMAGHQVIEADSTLRLLEAAEACRPDLILCALRSPGMDGRETIERLRTEPSIASIACLLFSGDEADCFEAMRAGADDFLTNTQSGLDLAWAVEARLKRQRQIAGDAGANGPPKKSLQHFAGELLEMVVKKAPVPEVLQRIANRLEREIGAVAVIPRIGDEHTVETIYASRISPRQWGELDRLVERFLALSLIPGEPIHTEMLMPLSSSLVVFMAQQRQGVRPDRLWHIPLRSEDGTLLGSFEVFLPAGAVTDGWLTGSGRAALDPVLHMSGILIERQRLLDKLQRQTHFDSATGLPNRREFERHLQEASRHSLETQVSFAIICMGIDRFQRVSDVHGYDIADEMLAEFASRLRLQCRFQDLTARTATDEFAVLVSDSGDLERTQKFAARLMDRLTEPYVIRDERLVVTVSMGISMFPQDANSGVEVLACAEAALLGTRHNSGRGKIGVFRAAEARPTIEGIEVEQYIEKALIADGFELHYQPLFRLHGPLTGCEALLRLRTGLGQPGAGKPGGLIRPDLVLPKAEETGLIVPIGAWVFETACRRLSQWRSAGIRLAVNVSARQLESDSLTALFAGLLDRYQVNPALIDLELTETSLIADHMSGKHRLAELRRLGFRIAIDDFGVGYSSLSYLRDFPVDKIKIDRSFVQQLDKPGPSLSVVEAILTLANNIGATVVAEGVETAAQYEVLAGAGCHEFQGFLFAKPMNEDRLMEFLKQREGWTADDFAHQQHVLA